MLLLLLAGPAHAGTWEYNGSTFILEASGAYRKFIYESPRAGLPVTRGTTVFEGRRSGQTYSGTAYVFSAGCGPIGYRVSGTVGADDRSVTLSGSVPVRNAQCKVVRQESNVLTFNLVDAASSGLSGRVPLTIGPDTVAFHTDLNGRTVWTNDAFEDFEYRFGKFVHESTGYYHAAEIGVRQIDGFNNAYAIVHQGHRYVLFDGHLWGNAGGGELKEAVLYGHELGHHICGHLQGALVDRKWDKELEADRFAGAAIRANFERGPNAATREEMLQAVRDVFVTAGFAEGGPTHPPLDLRLGAFDDGWRNGSDCAKRGYLTGRTEPDRERAR